MKTKWWAIVLMLICTVFTSIGQIFFKFASSELTLNLSSLFFNYYLWTGLFFYSIALALLIISFKGGEMSILYPIIALSYVWVSILSPFFFPNELMNTSKWLGVFFIVIGVSVIGWGSKNG